MFFIWRHPKIILCLQWRGQGYAMGLCLLVSFYYFSQVLFLKVKTNQ